MKHVKNILFAALFSASAIILSATLFTGNTVDAKSVAPYGIADSTGSGGGDTSDGSGGGIINPGGGH